MPTHEIVDKFSTHLKNALSRALCFAVENGQSAIEPEHLLWALLSEKGSLAAQELKRSHVNITPVRALIAHEGQSETIPQLSEDAKRALEKAILAANTNEHRHVGTEHLLFGLLQIKHKVNNYNPSLNQPSQYKK